MRRTAALALAASALTTAMVVSGCSADAAGDDTLQVVATTTQVGEFTAEVGGDAISLTQLLEPGQSAHAFDPSAAQLQALAAADVLVVSGSGLEPWVDDMVEASGFDGTLVDASTDLPFPPAADDHEHAEDEHAHDEDEHADDEHSDEHANDHADDGHDHGSGDPHVWTSPANAIAMVQTIESALAEAAPEAAAEIHVRAAETTAQLQALTDWITDAMAAVPTEQRLLVTNHVGFTAYATEYDVTLVGSIIPSFDDHAEPSAAEIDELIQAIRDTGVRAVFSETTLPGTLAETIAQEAGVEVYVGEDALYIDSLGAPGTAGATYIGSQLHNTQMILASWGAEVPQIPSELE